MSIDIVREYTPELHAAMNSLIPQLSRSTPELSEDFVREFLAQPEVYLFIYRGVPTDGGEETILGMLTLATFTIPTGKRAWIEDVVVDSAARGQGAGQALVEAAVEHGNRIGVKSIDLTSRPTREAANRLYRRVGFETRETNIYRFQG